MKIVDRLPVFIFVHVWIVGIAEGVIELARGKSTDYGEKYDDRGYWDGDKVVDGNKNTNVYCGSCVHTYPNNKATAWWRVNLTELYAITRVLIYNMEPYTPSENCSGAVKKNYAKHTQESDRLKGYSLFISNTSDHKNGHRCYKEPSPDGEYPALFQNVSCVGVGSYLTMFNDHRATFSILNGAAIVVCEIEVYGCLFGYYGEDCVQECSKYCLFSYCNPENGICYYGCQDGWLGNRCDKKCEAGYFGRNCSQRCSNCLDDDNCLHTNGQCPNGCKDGWRTDQCDEKCPERSYGKNCSEVCGKCKEQTCLFNNGTCASGCQNGYQGDICKQTCTNGTYGAECNRSCGNCKNSEACHYVNGTCTNGCAVGWKLETCDQKCGNGTYGQDCKGKCGQCRDSATCDNVNGKCPSECDAGWRYEKCDEKCESGKYGFRCQNQCGNCIDKTICDHIQGNCTAGCEPGYMDSLCKQKCRDGYFGDKCKMECGYCKGDAVCNNTNGYCPYPECEDGYKGMQCLEPCDTGKYGENCHSICANCNGTNNCNNVNGTCPFGCMPGFTGSKCDIEVESLITDPSSSILAPVGLSLGIVLIIAVLVIVVAFIIIRVRRQTHSTRNKNEASGSSRRSNFTEERDNAYVNVGMVHNMENNENDRRQQHVKFNNSADVESDTDDDFEDVRSTVVDHVYTLGDDEQLYANNSIVSTKISISDIRHIVEEKKSQKVLSAQFEALPKGAIHPHKAGELPENTQKNRFLATFPYDHSIVKLTKIKDNPNSDYINANYINGVNKPNAYIATQGPKSNTVYNFWRMIWEEGSGKIICLTRMKEQDKVKCMRYWPAKLGEDMKLKNFHLTMLSENTYGAFVIRNLRLKRMETGETRKITQFHFVSWPDHGTPDPMKLLQFQQLVSHVKSQTIGPDVVHCSAGIGRTGSYIALDALLVAGRQNGKVDVFSFVREMRNNRMNMIQTEDQYVMVHDALVEGFLVGESSIQKTDFLYVWRMHESRDIPKNKKCFVTEFQQLQNVRPILDVESKKEAMSDANKCKNRTSKVLPDRKYKPYLVSYAVKRNEYINAIILPSLTSNDGFFVTQYPLPETVSDFWCMVYDHDSNLIVFLEPNEERINLLPEANNCSTFGSVNVTYSGGTTSTHGINEKEVTIYKEGDETFRRVKILEATSWAWKTPIPSTSKLLLDMIRQVDNLKNTTETGPVTVVCCDGSVKCGLFCTIYNVIEWLNETDQIDVMFSARQLQLRRPQFLANVEQYKYCYTVVNDLLEETTVYANM